MTVIKITYLACLVLVLISCRCDAVKQHPDQVSGMLSLRGLWNHRQKSIPCESCTGHHQLAFVHAACKPTCMAAQQPCVWLSSKWLGKNWN